MRKLVSSWMALMALALPLSIAPPSAAEAKPKVIYLVLWRGWEDASEGFKDGLDSAGIDYELIVRNAEGQKDRLAGFVAEAKALDVDLVATWGTSVATGMLGLHAGDANQLTVAPIPAVFMIVSQPIGSGLVADLSSSGRNFTGSLYLVSEQTQLTVLNSFGPVKRLAVVYNPLEANSTINVKRLTQLAKERQFELLARPVPLTVDGQPDGEQIIDTVESLAALGVDWFYQGPDSFMNKNGSIYVTAATAFGIPTFASTDRLVHEAGALLSVSNSYRAAGVVAAGKAAAILRDGVDPADIPITGPKEPSIVINIDSALALETYPPLSLLGLSKIVTAVPLE
ncbi:ABC transporter substrate-binding protein [Litorivicinus lipolyticus]|uniref:ABC transporter substrate-binding protein n=1 Tax=Litorivicinus lipolyticus TaxID=418701 RepID=A0A5Q2Q7Y1_9GAMM|nr:ABC transporter substrate-binding protein [Litorivicinus lipolyticus]QGG80178.1 ABC transporter substrate-binding protein [Litorivicinus lipolyticus]